MICLVEHRKRTNELIRSLVSSAEHNITGVEGGQNSFTEASRESVPASLSFTKQVMFGLLISHLVLIFLLTVEMITRRCLVIILPSQEEIFRPR